MHCCNVVEIVDIVEVLPKYFPVPNPNFDLSVDAFYNLHYVIHTIFLMYPQQECILIRHMSMTIREHICFKLHSEICCISDLIAQALG